MNMDILIFIGMLGLITGFISGLLGIGGGILMAPLLLYMPPLFGFAPLTMHTVAGLTIVQGLFACIAGGLTHKKFPYFSGQLVAWMGIVLFIASFTGGMASSITANEILLVIFAIMAVTASIVILLPRKTDVEYPDITDFKFSRLRAVSVAGSIGILGGLVGQGGSFILIPLMTSYIKVPTRIAIGSNLAIVFLSSLAAFLGKAATSQIDWQLALPIVMTVVPGACIGAYTSQKISVSKLRTILAFCIAIAAVRVSLSAVGY
jgi:uncharacterized membrane protein YfcA